VDLGALRRVEIRWPFPHKEVARLTDVDNSRIIAIGTANPPLRLTQQESFRMAGYKSERIRQIFQHCDIDYRHFYLEGELNRHESSDELNERYLRGAMRTGCQAIRAALDASGVNQSEVDFLAICSSTGYVCPDVGSRLIAHMGFGRKVQRAALLGLGCAGALPTLQRAADFARVHPGRIALVLAVEICSACYFVDDTLETAVGNAICADGAAAFLVSTGLPANTHYPEILDFESFLDCDQIDKVGFDRRDGKLRIVLAPSIRKLAGPMIENALNRLLQRNQLSTSDIRFWVLHPGGRKVMDGVQRYLELNDSQMRFSRAVLRNYGNMSSPTVMFVLDEVVRNGDPRPGDWGVMIALGPGMAAEAALLRW
jgi:polyketide synthase Type III